THFSLTLVMLLANSQTLNLLPPVLLPSLHTHLVTNPFVLYHPHSLSPLAFWTICPQYDSFPQEYNIFRNLVLPSQPSSLQSLHPPHSFYVNTSTVGGPFATEISPHTKMA